MGKHTRLSEGTLALDLEGDPDARLVALAYAEITGDKALAAAIRAAVRTYQRRAKG